MATGKLMNQVIKRISVASLLLNIVVGCGQPNALAIIKTGALMK
jgi:hypothetical protein